MPKKICPNGHIYDSTIYGDECPLCPKSPSASNSIPNTGVDPSDAGGTRINPPSQNVNNPFSNPVNNGPMPAAAAGRTGGGDSIDASGATRLQGARPAGHGLAGSQPAPQPSNRTMIRPPQGGGKTNGRKLVGFLVTYNRYPLGKSFEIYEGKNFIGRDPSCDICIPDDNQISGKHLMILYRNIDKKYRYHDEQSSNGTFVNKQVSDEGVLENYDVIRLGNTVFTFIAIPQL